MTNNIKILEQNVNGLLQYQKQLQTILDLEQIDVYYISKTHFTKESYIQLKGCKYITT